MNLELQDFAVTVDAVEAATGLDFFSTVPQIIASHMDNVGHATVWRKDIREFADRCGATKRLLIPEDGEACDF